MVQSSKSLTAWIPSDLSHKGEIKNSKRRKREEGSGRRRTMWNIFSTILPNPNRKTLAKLFLLSLLCLLSYLTGIYFPTATSSSSTAALPSCNSLPNLTRASSFSSPYTIVLDFTPHHFLPIPEEVYNASAIIPFCASNFTNHCPCQDPKREHQFRIGKMFHRERHCPTRDEDRGERCRIPRPVGYKTQFRWPESRDRAWFANVPSTRLSESKKDQNWVRVEGNVLVFPGGGTSFPSGVKGYVEEMASIVPLQNGEIRTAIDIGCGVASFGGQLLDYNVLTLSVAPRDVHEAQVQFALERGLPAILGVLSVTRLPHPSMSFDMAHCARCLVHWRDHGGLYLMEMDRLLRPGGYWVLSGPPINWKEFYEGWGRTPDDLNMEQDAIEKLASRLCWEKFAEKGPIAVWRKPISHAHCQNNSKLLKSPPFCNVKELDVAWYKKMDTCIAPLPITQQLLERWPQRLTATPPRILNGDIEGITAATFIHDNETWKKRLEYYEAYVHSLSAGKYRNIMDMNAGLGGFAAALIEYPVWVMNVVPFDTKNDTLGIIFERGLIGTYMDWCEAYSTYPRTYDLIHADGIFSMYSHKCDIIDILLEMDRILRPEGVVIVRDHVDNVVKAKRASERLKWNCRIVHSEKGPFHPEKLLIVDNSIDVNV